MLQSTQASSSDVLSPEHFRADVERFNADDAEDVVNLVPNAGAFAWMAENVPLFDCPDEDIRRTYYYRWWTYRKHIKQTPAGRVVTEFILPVSHAGLYNTISCALGHHLAEGRWLKDQGFLDEYVRFWFRGGENGGPAPKFHKYSSWVHSALLERARVTGDVGLLRELFDDLVRDYEAWEAEHRLPDGLFWQYDVWDGMEESISGGRKQKNTRPTISSYMYGNAIALAEMAQMFGRADVEGTYREKAARLKTLVQEHLWDGRAEFFKVRFEDGTLSDAREAIGFIPWCFNLPDKGREGAWKQLVDPEGFWAPKGITTAERRHPKFRSHGVGKCEWDGAVWPFATSQTLGAMANVLRHDDQTHVTPAHYLEAVRTYAAAHQFHGKPYIGEYYDEVTGDWLKGQNPRSRYYNHSTFCDLVISGLVGLQARADETVEVSPLLPSGAWDYFCLDRVPYHGRRVAVIWDRDGKKYGRGAGLQVLVDGRHAAWSAELGPVAGRLNGNAGDRP